jgi:hypothetical protein
MTIGKGAAAGAEAGGAAGAVKLQKMGSYLVIRNLPE